MIANLSLASTMYNSIFMFRYLEYNLQLDLNYQTGLCGVFAVLHSNVTTFGICISKLFDKTLTNFWETGNVVIRFRRIF